jgi:tetratricopeptide (TPR) repeat protein
LEKRPDQQTRAESKAQLVEQINGCLHSGEYSRALDLLRGKAAEFSNDVELSDLEKRAQDGVKRKAEADRLITESQELFAQQKSAEAIQLLRKAYELDKRNSLARAILANALVEHAQSILETDWLGAETLTNQALALNPAHPTAKTVQSRIVEQKQNSSAEDWVAQARKLQSSGDLFAALAWVAEGMAVHPDDPKLLQIQDAIQRDQGARRRQARRGDVEDLRRMELEIDGVSDVAAKQALAARIQALAAKHWTDGEILSIANGLLNRLGLAPQEGSTKSPQGKGATVIFHVPRSTAPKPTAVDSSPVPEASSLPSPTPPVQASPIPAPPPAEKAPAIIVPPSRVPTSKVPQPSILRPPKVAATSAEAQLPPALVVTMPPAAPSAAAAKVASPSSQPRQSKSSHASTLILVAVAAIILVAATFFFTRRHYASPVAKTPSTAPAVSAPAVSGPAVSAPNVSTPAASARAQATPEPSAPAMDVSSDTAAGKVTAGDQPPADSGHVEAGRNAGTLLVVAGQDDAKVFLDGKLQPQLTRGGQLSLPNLELKDYVVQVSKNGFQDPPQQKITVRKGEHAKLIFSLQPQPRPNSQPQPRMATLTIQGGAPGTAVLVDQTPVGTIQPDGTLSVATLNPGDHTVELRKDRFKPRQFMKHFTAGGTVSLAAADAALEAAPGELKITFTPADATVALVKGDLLKMVSSGVPLNLPSGTYTLTARTAERFTRTSTFEVVAGQSKTLDLSLAPSGMSKWDDPGAWKHEGDAFIRKGGDFVLYGAAPTSGTFVFSAMPTKGHVLQWVLNYSDSKNYVLFQMDDNNFSRAVVRNGQKTDEIKVPDKSDKKSFRMLQIRVSPAEIVHQIKHGNNWTVLDHWAQPGANLSSGKFGFYLPGNDEVAISSFAHYADLNIH